MSHKEAELFRAKYKIAVEEGRDTFIFFGQDVLVTYAKYMIENLINQGILDD